MDRYICRVRRCTLLPASVKSKKEMTKSKNTTCISPQLASFPDLALRLGATRAAIIKVADIQFSESFRHQCGMNTCGKFGTNWMCPPAVGPFEDLKKQVLAFEKGLVIQTVYQLEDSFDYEGMMNALNIHDDVFRRILHEVKNILGDLPLLPLNAGVCRFCEKCTYPDKDCIFPDEALASVEAFGIDVTALVTACSMPYNNGQASVSYVGMILCELV